MALSGPHPRGYHNSLRKVPLSVSTYYSGREIWYLCVKSYETSEYYILYCIFFAFAGTLTAQGAEANNPQAGDVLHEFLSAFTNSDVDGIVNLFSEDAIFWGTGSMELVEETAGIRLYFSGLSKRPPGQALARAQNFSIMELSSDSVLISGMWEVVPQCKNTGTPLRISMALSLQDGIWKIVQFHNSAMPGS